MRACCWLQNRVQEPEVIPEFRLRMLIKRKDANSNFYEGKLTLFRSLRKHAAIFASPEVAPACVMPLSLWRLSICYQITHQVATKIVRTKFRQRLMFQSREFGNAFSLALKIGVCWHSTLKANVIALKCSIVEMCLRMNDLHLRCY